MCRRTTCRTCGKPTWAGCGNHIEQALAEVPVAKRCSCSSEPATAQRPTTGTRSLLDRLLRR